MVATLTIRRRSSAACREPAQRQEKLGRYAVGVFSQCHVRDIQKPLDPQVVRLLVQVAREVLDRLT